MPDISSKWIIRPWLGPTCSIGPILDMGLGHLLTAQSFPTSPPFSLGPATRPGQVMVFMWVSVCVCLCRPLMEQMLHPWAQICREVTVCGFSPLFPPNFPPEGRGVNKKKSRNLVWSGLVWSGLVWSGLVRSGLDWFGIVRSGLRHVCSYPFSYRRSERVSGRGGTKTMNLPERKWLW